MIGSSTVHVESGTRYKKVEIVYRISDWKISTITSIIVKEPNGHHYVVFSSDLDVEFVHGEFMSIKEFKEAAQQGLEEFKEACEES